MSQQLAARARSEQLAPNFGRVRLANGIWPIQIKDRGSPASRTLAAGGQLIVTLASNNVHEPSAAKPATHQDLWPGTPPIKIHVPTKGHRRIDRGRIGR